jgi:hypothetical protein
MPHFGQGQLGKTLVENSVNQSRRLAGMFASIPVDFRAEWPDTSYLGNQYASAQLLLHLNR